MLKFGVLMIKTLFHLLIKIQVISFTIDGPTIVFLKEYGIKTYILYDTNWELKAVCQKEGKKDVMGDISVCADRLGLSIRERTIFASSVAKSLEADIEDTNISVQSVWPHG